MIKVGLFLAILASATEVFMVPHSHTDAGWIEDPDVFYTQYYYGDKIKGILTTIQQVLQENPARKFTWSETLFFSRWYNEQQKETKEAFKRLVKDGRLEFVGGGLVQNDEALPNLEMIVRNMEEGQKFLHDEFGIDRLKVAWQIDPFGHSGLTPGLFQSLGYEVLVGNRIDQDLREQLKKDGNLEFLWEGSNLGQTTGMFTHILPSSYSFPEYLNPMMSNNCWLKIELDDW